MLFLKTIFINLDTNTTPPPKKKPKQYEQWLVNMVIEQPLLYFQMWNIEESNYFFHVFEKLWKIDHQKDIY